MAVRGFAAEHARRDLGEPAIHAAIGRSLDHYLHTMVHFLYDIPRPFAPAPPEPGVLPERLAGESETLGWAQAEHQVLLQATAQAASVSSITRAWQIFACQASFLGGHGYWADCQAAGRSVLAAARDCGDDAALGWTHATIGWYGTFTGAHDEDRAHQEQALEHFRHAGDVHGQAWAHLFASLACSWKGGDSAQAVTHSDQALTLFRRVGDQAGERWALLGLGNGHAYLGDYESARGFARQALELGAEAGDPLNLALAWRVLGFVHVRSGEHSKAINCYRHGLGLARERRTPLARRWLAGLLTDLGDACQASGDAPAACEAWQEALQIRDELRMPDSERIRARLQGDGTSRQSH